MSNKHIFCIMLHELDQFYKQTTITLTNKDHIQRVCTILRLKEHDTLRVFNKVVHALCIIERVSCKSIILQVTAWHKNNTAQPFIALMLPILKKASFEEALYNATEHGVNHIIVYTCHKSQKNFEYFNNNRLEKIIIGAAEQSRNYVYPALEGPYLFNQSFLTSIARRYQQLLFLDQEGTCVAHLELSNQSIALLIGPEGDLDPDEKALVTHNAVVRLRLTSTILRASQAAGTAVGLIRSLAI